MSFADDEEPMPRSVVLQNAQSILQVRQHSDDALLLAKRDLEFNAAQLAQSLATMRATVESTIDVILAVDGKCRVSAFNARLADMFGLRQVLASGADHRQLVRRISVQFNDAEQFLARLQGIDGSPLPESYDLLELADGRVLERFSQIHVLPSLPKGGSGASAISPSGATPRWPCARLQACILSASMRGYVSFSEGDCTILLAQTATVHTSPDLLLSVAVFAIIVYA
ncbi:hypothetical protein [Janthinobacterium sp. CG3]|uniref:hypothetical protein n=1 Tax=Janthinobacterium sp. CG3 TaxID=1075768 RepID=UPI000345E8F3|nr:hypothetical protein [Janthinobacterium sp. CG3]